MWRGVSRLSVNWDEFHYLSRIYEYQRGELLQRLQTLHVHFFGWLPGVSPSEVDQVLAARTALFFVVLGSAWLLHGLARRFLTATGALFAVACFFGFTYLSHHGPSFRFDPLCAFLLLAAARLAVARSRAVPAAVVSGAATAVALLVSIKSVLYLPLLGALLLCDPVDLPRQRAARLFAFSLALALGFGGLYLAHAATLPGAGDFDAAGFARHAGAGVLAACRL